MRACLPCLPILLLLPASTPAEEAGRELFEKKVRPVLVAHCYRCHSTEAKQRKGGLLVDSREGMRKGGDSGPAVVPGDTESLLLKAVRQSGDLKMPPKGKLPDAVIADFEAWVRLGAPDPRDRPTPALTAGNWDEILRTRRTWWSLQPVRKPPVPAVKGSSWSAHPTDRFLLAALEAKGLTPVADADPRTLVRRLSLVLTGLPPSPEEVEAFVRDRSPDAYEKLVDRLLASPHHGERWARHWMDVVRFTETHGNEWNYEVHHAWRYRDYLIRAFNADVPYDQFIREHVAGDLLPRPRWNKDDRFNESVIGTAFYRFGEVNHDDCIDLPQIGYDVADNQIDTLTKAFQATTVACARCHDHKIDAVSMKDYYALLGILRSSRLVSHTIDAPEVNARPMERLAQLKEQIRTEIAKCWQEDAAALARDPARLERRLSVLKQDKLPLEDPLNPLAALSRCDEKTLPQAWRDLAGRWSKEERERAEFNRTRFRTLADFTTGFADWQVGGHGLKQGAAQAGEFVLASDGDTLVKAVLPAGCFTHRLSERLNGTLRSPALAGAKHVSLLVCGEHSAAVRLVSNNCQLNYRNYRALTSPELRWVTFSMPPDAAGLRPYAELMTMLDNPKFPDQLSGLGGDRANYRIPWEQAAADPRSYWGIVRAVIHDDPQPPKPELGHLRPLFADPAPTDWTGVAGRFAAVAEAAIRAWASNRATDSDALWLDVLVRRGLLGNSVRLTPRLEQLVREYRAAEKELALPRIVPGLADFGPGFEQPVFERGDCLRPGMKVPRRYLEVLTPASAGTSAGSGRLMLAETIASKANPLTARVMVNRVWHHLFGTGLVRTTDDFGRVGDLPSHPELLDHLAARFVEEGWSIKRLIRSLVLTRTFRLSSRPDPKGAETDPQNRFLAHYPARRLEAEAVRDSILAVSGRLDRTLFGPSVHPYRDRANPDRRLFPGPLDGNGRRSIYMRNNLMESPHFLGVFNFPGGKVAQGRRDVTNVPAQALALLNDPFVHQQAEFWAGRVVARSDSLRERIDWLFRTALGRPASPHEQQRFEQAARQLAELHQVPADGILKSREVWKDLAHTMFNLKEFLYVP